VAAIAKFSKSFETCDSLLAEKRIHTRNENIFLLTSNYLKGWKLGFRFSCLYLYFQNKFRIVLTNQSARSMELEYSVQDIYIYPIKSLGGIRLEAAEVEEKGFKYDRRWMLVDESGLFLSQRTIFKLAQLHVKLINDIITVFKQDQQEERIVIPVAQETEQSIKVTVWDDEMDAKLVGTIYDDWFSRILSMKVRLVKMPDSTQRKVNSKYAINDESVSFADGMPYLLIGQSSLDDINGRIEIPVPMNRFRPNIVFSGGQAFSEDAWKRIVIGEITFQVVKPCPRCVMPTIDQNSGVKSKEPMKTLATYRSVGSKVLFGQNMIAINFGIFRVGDSIKLL